MTKLRVKGTESAIGHPKDQKATITKLRVKWIKSSIGYPKDQKATITALGLRKLQQTVEHDDQPALRGMIRKVCHLVEVEEIIVEGEEITSETL